MSGNSTSKGTLYGTNSLYLEELYEQYIEDKNSVPDHWRDFFAGMDEGASAASSSAGTSDGLMPAAESDKQSRVSQMINAFRAHGHRRAHINPIAAAPDLDDDLKPIAFGLTAADLDEEFSTEGVLPQPKAKLRDIFEAIRNTYCRTIGVQFTDIPRNERIWLQQRMEGLQNKPKFSAEEKQRILKGLMVAENFEQFLHKKFVGVKRFSLEGGETLIPMLDVMIDAAGESGVTDVVMGMAHRGRLNVLVNILNKPLEHMFSEFAGTWSMANDCSSGDVKYHKGKAYDITTNKGYDLHVSLLPNPSHLETIDPVVEGSTRARQKRIGDTERRKVMPLLIHGDTAFIGQGVVAETFNLGTVEAYTTGGTVHVVINNQLGYTALPHEGFGTEYCTDFAKMLQVPIFHVNADDPEACCHVMQLAMAYRSRFQRDVVIDMVCYRKYGHNEGDDPSFTQPLMYDTIKNHSSTYAIYQAQLADEGTMSKDDSKKVRDDHTDVMQKALDKAKEGVEGEREMFNGIWSEYSLEDKDEADTSISEKTLKAISDATVSWPDSFTPHPKVAKGMEKRSENLLEGGMDWGAAEMAAYGALVSEGVSVRLTGQDARRGTFSHRHGVLIDYKTAQPYTPLQTIATGDAELEIHNSTLSEYAVMGFEFGYSMSSPKNLTVWEAQFGDFANGAQIIIDQFLASSETKWDRMSGLVLLLPHGMEGQGPEHSSARLERFLQLCAENNMTVCNPTTPAQIFHLLRRQVMRKVRRPLVVMSPKSLLRHPKAVSSPEDLTSGKFLKVIQDNNIDIKKARRVVLCSGKLYYDLIAAQEEKGKQAEDVAIVRLEQLYPLPLTEINAALKGLNSKAEIVWAQEEPRNQGAWWYVQDTLQPELKQNIRLIARPSAAAPAVGSPKRHMEEQKEICDAVFAAK